MRTIIAGFAEYEREVISERIRAGIAKARAHGKHWDGNKPGQLYRLTDEKLAALFCGTCWPTAKSKRPLLGSSA